MVKHVKFLIALGILMTTACVPGITVDEPTETPFPGTIRIGNVITRDTDVIKILASDHVVLPNCEGTGTLTVTRSFAKEIERRPSFSMTVSAGDVVVDVPAEAVLQAIMGYYHLQEGEVVTSESYDVKMTVPPGTMVTYEIQWVLISKSGVIEITVINEETGSEDIVYLEFHIPSSLEARIQPPVRESCEGE